MSSYRKKIWEESLIPFEVIEALVQGDMEACQDVLKSFEKYIEKVCTVSVGEINGRVITEVDYSMKAEVELKLLGAIGKFRVLGV